MNTSALAAFSAAALSLGLFISSAAANEHSRHSRVWWGSSSGYAGSPYDEYSYSGVRWYGDAGYRYARHNDFGEGYGDSLEYDYGGYDYGEHRHSRRYGHSHRRHGHGHHRRRHHDRDDD